MYEVFSPRKNYHADQIWLQFHYEVLIAIAIYNCYTTNLLDVRLFATCKLLGCGQWGILIKW